MAGNIGQAVRPAHWLDPGVPGVGHELTGDIQLMRALQDLGPLANLPPFIFAQLHWKFPVGWQLNISLTGHDSATVGEKGFEGMLSAEYHGTTGVDIDQVGNRVENLSLAIWPGCTGQQQDTACLLYTSPSPRDA